VGGVRDSSLTSALDDNDLPRFAVGWRRTLGPPTVVRARADWVDRARQLREAKGTVHPRALLEHDPALLRIEPPPPSQAIGFAFSYGNAHLVPTLMRIWPLPDDLPHAAGTGNAVAVARCSTLPASRSRIAGAPLSGQRSESDPTWVGAAVTAQQVLDVALAWAVLNRHFEIASFLLDHGATSTPTGARTSRRASFMKPRSRGTRTP